MSLEQTNFTTKRAWKNIKISKWWSISQSISWNFVKKSLIKTRDVRFIWNRKRETTVSWIIIIWYSLIFLLSIPKKTKDKTLINPQLSHLLGSPKQWSNLTTLMNAQTINPWAVSTHDTWKHSLVAFVNSTIWTSSVTLTSIFRVLLMLRNYRCPIKYHSII